jgi:Tol biopolymer transport system component
MHLLFHDRLIRTTLSVTVAGYLLGLFLIVVGYWQGQGQGSDLASSAGNAVSALGTLTTTPYPSATPPSLVLATPAPLAQLANHCEATSNTYWLHVGTRQSVSFTTSPVEQQVLSPTGEFMLLQTGSTVFVEQAGSPDIVQLDLDGYVYIGGSNSQWSATGVRLAIIQDDPAVPGVSLYDFSAGLRGYRWFKVIIPVNSPTNLLWSPEGEYLAVNRQIISFSQRKVIYDGAWGQRVWSPDSRWLASYGPYNQGYVLHLVRPDTGQNFTFSLDHEVLYTFWSPDSQHILVIEKGALAQVYGIDGQVWALGQKQSVGGGGNLYLPPASDDYKQLWSLPFFWQPDGAALYFWRYDTESGYNLVRWTPDQPVEVVLKSTGAPILALGRLLPDPWIYGDGTSFLALQPALYQEPKIALHDRIAVKEHQTYHQQIKLLRPDGSAPTVLVADAHDVRKLVWSNDGLAFGVVWAIQDQARQRVFASWDVMGQTVEVELENDISLVHSLEFAPENAALVLIVERPGGESVMMFDALTGKRTTLLEQIEDVAWPTFYSPDGFYTLRWISRAGESGYDAYKRDGSRLFRIADPPFHVWSRIFFSPDRQWAAIKTGDQSGEALALAKLDGSPARILVSGLQGLGNPSWSPDSKMINFTYQFYNADSMLEIINIEGEKLWSTPYHYPRPNPDWPQTSPRDVVLTWQKCP